MYDNVVLIPYRNRQEHLHYFINNTVPLFEKWLPNTKVVVLEQTDGKLFNRGALLNIGFKEYQNKTKYFFTHDVDINPNETIVRKIYTDNRNDVYRIKSAHDTSLGGVVKISHDVIFNINGFPNYIWGWGIEDRALYHRCRMRNVNITNNVDKDFHVLTHAPNGEVYIGEKKRISDMWRDNYISKLDENKKTTLIMESGLNNIEYKLIKRVFFHHCVELIQVCI